MQDRQREDEALIRRVASGDRDALGVLYDRHGGTMMAIGLKVMRNPREAEDVLHDVFLEAWSRAGTYDPHRASVRAWLHLRMRSRCLDRLKSAGWKHRASWSADADGRDVSAPAMEYAADASFLRAALAELPPEQRAAVVLGYFRGLSSREIAAQLGIPVGTVKSRVAAAMGSMRAALVEDT